MRRAKSLLGASWPLPWWAAAFDGWILAQKLELSNVAQIERKGLSRIALLRGTAGLWQYIDGLFISCSQLVHFQLLDDPSAVRLCRALEEATLQKKVASSLKIHGHGGWHIPAKAKLFFRTSVGRLTSSLTLRQGLSMETSKIQSSSILATGESVVVAKSNAHLRPNERREAGLFKGQVKLDEQFFEPMNDSFMQFFQ